MCNKFVCGQYIFQQGWLKSHIVNRPRDGYENYCSNFLKKIPMSI